MAFFEVLNNQQSHFNRYFRRNEGTTDYATIPEVTLAGDFVIEFDFLASEVSGHFLSNSSKTNRFGFERATNRVFIQTDNGLTRFEHNVELQLYSKVMLSRVSGVLSCVLNDEQLNLQDDSPTGLTNTGAFYLNQIYNKWVNPTSVEIFKGIIANLKIYDNGTLIHHWKINSNAATEADLVSGAIMTFVNGNADDWGLFDRQASGDWKGNGLAVPPWDSVDQVLNVV